MGRKIQKSRRHKKVKPDELINRNSNAFKLQQQQNSAPVNVDIQEVPKKMLMLFESRDSFKNTKTKRKKHKKLERITVVQSKLEDEQKGMTRPLKPIPQKMTQMDNESTFHFLNRIQKIADKAMAEAKLEAKFNVNVHEDAEKEVHVIVEPKIPSQKKQEKRKLYGDKKKAKKQKRDDNRIDEFAHLKDEVKFGEVVTEPPTVKAHAKQAVSKRNDKNTKSKLLLNKLLPAEVKDSLNLTGRSKSVNLTKKRKELSLSQRKMVEDQQQQAISMYRKMKQSKKKAFTIKS